MERISIVWNLTQRCIWNCSFCCVDAKYVPPASIDNLSVYDNCNKELTFEQKLIALKNINPKNYRIDFSGGEIFIDKQNVHLLKYASELIGSENVGISTSGACFTDNMLAELTSCGIKDFELTIDAPLYYFYPYRPIGYHQFAALGINELKKYSVNVGVQTVITRCNANLVEENI